MNATFRDRGRGENNEKIISSTFYDEFSFSKFPRTWDGIKNIWLKFFFFFQIMTSLRSKKKNPMIFLRIFLPYK